MASCTAAVTSRTRTKKGPTSADEDVAGEYRPVVEERHGHVVGEHDRGRLRAGDDATEEIVGHDGQYPRPADLTSPSMRVTLFVTCVVDLFEPDVGVATV